MSAPVHAEINERLRRAARNGTRLHLDLEHVRALMDPRIYSVLAEIEAEEVRKQWQTDESQQQSVSSLVPSGSGIARTATIGTSVISPDVSRGARRQVSAALAENRLKRQKTS